MSTLDETDHQDASPNLFRMLGSSFEGEAHNALAMMKHLLETEGLTFNDIATVIENCNGEIEERKYSDTDAEIIFAKGRGERPRRRGAQARSCRRNSTTPMAIRTGMRSRCFARKTAHSCVSEWERTFINDMAGKTLWREPTEKQAKHLLAIFVKLGGHYDPQSRTPTSLISPLCRRRCEQITKLKRWVVWRWELRTKKNGTEAWTKPPYQCS